MNQIRKSINLFEKYHKLKIKILLNKDVSSIRSSCFFCDSTDHFLDCCEKLTININPLNHLTYKN